MKFIDKKFRKNKKQYILQTLMATVALFMVLLYVEFVTHSAIVVSLGATSFILFTMPHTQRSKARYILGGYAMGILSGVFCSVFVASGISPLIFGSIAVGLCMFLMVVFNFEHPPAAGLALGIVIEGFDLQTVIFVYFVAILLIGFTYLNRKWFINLL